MLLLHGGNQIVAVEAQGALCCPGATRIGGVGIGLILIHHHVDGDVFLGIEVDELTEHIGVGLQIAWLLNEIVLRGQLPGKHASPHQCGILGLTVVHLSTIKEEIVLGLRLLVPWARQHGIVLIDLHPCGGTPGRHPEGHLWLVFLRLFDEANDVRFVVLDVEVLQGEVATHRVARVPRPGIVVGVHRQASAGKLQVAVRGEDAAHHLFLLLRFQHLQRVEVQLVEAGAPRLEHMTLLLAGDDQCRLCGSLAAE